MDKITVTRKHMWAIRKYPQYYPGTLHAEQSAYINVFSTKLEAENEIKAIEQRCLKGGCYYLRHGEFASPVFKAVRVGVAVGEKIAKELNLAEMQEFIDAEDSYPDREIDPDTNQPV